MPIYEYCCERCGKVFDVLVRPPVDLQAVQFQSCPDCQIQAKRVEMSKTCDPVFKGSGFYTTDYVKKGKK